MMMRWKTARPNFVTVAIDEEYGALGQTPLRVSHQGKIPDIPQTREAW